MEGINSAYRPEMIYSHSIKYIILTNSTSKGTNYTATCLLSRKLSKLDETMHARHCWRSRNELTSGVFLWTPTYGRGKAGRPARTYSSCARMAGCSPEDLPEAINEREKWRERVRYIRARGMTWWWWWWLLLIFDRGTSCVQ